MTPDDDLSARAAAAIARALADTTLPAGVLTEGPATGEASALLGELLRAFGLADAQQALPDVEDEAELTRRRKLAGSGLPADALTVGSYARELSTMLPVLRERVAELRELRRLCCADPLPTGATLEAARARIVERWNAALDSAGAVTLPPFCEVCGMPVLLRRTERDGERVELSTVCGNECRDARKKRNRRR